MLPLIRKRVSEGVKLLVIISDGGADFNPNFLINQVYLSRLFRKTGLQSMLVTTYCPGHSALNPIEHLWAPLTQALVGVYLPDILPGEDQPPCKQSGLAPEEKENKEKRVFDIAMKALAMYWRNVNFASIPPSINVVPCGQEKDAEWNEYNRVHTAVSGALYKMRACPDVEDELSFLSSHMDRRIGTLVFTKCNSACGFCVDSANDDQLLSLMKSFPSPAPSNVLDGHFATFIESLSLPRCQTDEHMPAVLEKNLGKCNHCYNFMFTSKKNKDDHKRLFHSTRLEPRV